MSEQLTARFQADTAAEAVEKAKAWIRDEPKLRLRTICSVRPASEPDQAPAWLVTVAVVTA